MSLLVRAGTTLATLADSQPDTTGEDYSRPNRNPGHSPQVATGGRRRRPSILNAVLAGIGLWVATTAVFLPTGGDPAVVTNNVFVGLVIALAAGYNYYRAQNEVPPSPTVASLIVTLGLWLVVAAPAFEMGGAVFWSTFAAGFAVAGLAGYTVYEARTVRRIAHETFSRR
ncbi:SPW repeat domain-containing protein [Natronosalvus vescus]|uniref:SPW repeat domain-containing protein n=1 Tax=Natronosalvus vescus TaxID=2953881 RepID=UPI0020900566|nr:hypothetical protein [Natronosalvus vescus]